MPSTFDPLLRLELQAVGENPLTWGTKTNTNLQLLAQAVSGHLSINIGGSGTYTLSTVDAGVDEARYAFITLTGTLTGNRTIQIPSNAKTYIFRRNTSGAFNVEVKTASGVAVSLADGITQVACNGTDCFRVLDPTAATAAQVSAEVSALTSAIAAVSARTSVNAAQIATVSALVSANTANIAVVSALTSVNSAAITSINGAVPRLAASNLFTANQQISKANPSLDLIKSTSGQSSLVFGYTSTVARWSIALGDAAAESGGNAGSNFSIFRYNDAGTFVDTPFAIVRSTGRVQLGQDGVDSNDAVRKGQLDEALGSISAIVSTGSGTEFDVTSLPSWVNELEILFRNVSLNGTGAPLIQLGTASGFVTTGYSSGGATRFGSSNVSAGFLFGEGVISTTGVTGVMRIIKQSGNVWVGSYTAMVNAGDGFSSYGAGSIDLGGTLTQVRVTRTGSASFDAGDFVIRWRR